MVILQIEHGLKIHIWQAGRQAQTRVNKGIVNYFMFPSFGSREWEVDQVLQQSSSPSNQWLDYKSQLVGDPGAMIMLSIFYIAWTLWHQRMLQFWFLSSPGNRWK